MSSPPIDFRTMRERNMKGLRFIALTAVCSGGVALVLSLPNLWMRRLSGKVYSQLRGSVLDVYPAFTEHRFSMLQTQVRDKHVSRVVLLETVHKEMKIFIAKDPNFMYSGVPFESEVGVIGEPPLSFPDDTFDTVHCHYGLSQGGGDHEGAVKEMLRVSKKRHGTGFHSGLGCFSVFVD
eukprot:PhF_6_TR19125/c0_g1_i1/m.28133